MPIIFGNKKKGIKAGGKVDTAGNVSIGGKYDSSGSSGGTSIPPIKPGVPSVSSTEAQGEYNKISGKLDKRSLIDASLEGKYGETARALALKQQTGNKEEDKIEETPVSSGDPIYDQYNKTLKDGEKEIETWGTNAKKEIENLLPMTLANIDDTYRATVDNIRSTYNRLIDEQQRINELDVARTKAYGIQAGAQYMPMEFTQAVSGAERRAASDIAKLNNERNALIAEAKAARDEGEITAMRTKMEDIIKVEEVMRQRTTDLFNQVEKRFELVTAMREEQEKRRIEAVTKAVEMASMKYASEFENADTPEEKDVLIKKILVDSKGTLTGKDYYTVYSSINEAIANAAQAEEDAKDKALEREKKEADIANTWSLISDRNNGDPEEREANAWAALNEAIDSVDEKGKPLLTDPNGFLTGSGFKDLEADIKEENISREKFLKEIGWRLDYKDEAEARAKYGLTLADLKILGDTI